MNIQITVKMYFAAIGSTGEIANRRSEKRPVPREWSVASLNRFRLSWMIVGVGNRSSPSATQNAPPSRYTGVRRNISPDTRCRRQSKSINTQSFDSLKMTQIVLNNRWLKHRKFTQSHSSAPVSSCMGMKRTIAKQLQSSRISVLIPPPRSNLSRSPRLSSPKLGAPQSAVRH